MARPSDFVDPDYDRRLAAFKEMKEQMKKEQAESSKPAEPRRKLSY
ncbi:MAG: hypothetical protein WCK29_03775 [archaeon]